MSNHPVRPEDILPDNIDTASIGDMTVRKGSVAAFLRNLDALENPNCTDAEKAALIATMEEIVDGIVAVGVHRHVVFKNKIAQEMVDRAARKLLGGVDTP